MTDNHDDMLFQMLKECKTLPKFLDQVFGFLQRRTDFYVVTNEPNAAVGLPDGLAEKLIRHSFYKYIPQTAETVYNDFDIPAATEQTVVTDSDGINEVSSTTDNLRIADWAFSNSDYYNGALHDNYCWSQTILEVNVVVRVPDGVTKKDIGVVITPTRISVQSPDGTYILQGELCQKCKTDAIWSIDGNRLEIHLDKCQDTWWNCLVKSEPLIDVTKIDCTRPYEDLPEEAQAKIEELQWNQEQKRLGLPTSEEVALRENLRKAWDVEGSPFSGSFDPDAVTFT